MKHLAINDWQVFITMKEVREMLTQRKKKGQSTLEYVLIFTAIIAGITMAANGVMRNTVTGAIGNVADKISTASNNIKN